MVETLSASIGQVACTGQALSVSTCAGALRLSGKLVLKGFQLCHAIIFHCDCATKCPIDGLATMQPTLPPDIPPHSVDHAPNCPSSVARKLDLGALQLG